MVDYAAEPINIAKIMEEIQLEAQAIAADLPVYMALNEQDTANTNNFSYDSATLKTRVQLTADVQNVVSEKPIHSFGGLLGRISVFIKKITRKLVRFYIVPIVDDQNRFNERNVACLQNIEKSISALKTQVETSELVETANADGCSLLELALIVRQTHTRKLALLEQETNRLAAYNTAAQQTVADLQARVEQQDKALELLRYDCEILQKRAALADIK